MEFNSKINELWGQALDKAVPDTYTSLSWTQVEKIKAVFAELIVRECAKVCDDLDIDDWGDKSFDDGTYYCSRAIKEHFGVEE